jgi:hypothetical protein
MDPERVPDPDVVVLEVDYEPGTPDPGRVFRSMSTLIEAFVSLDRDLARAVTVSLEPSVVLERVEAGSIRTFLRQVLLQVDDDALRNLDWKPLIGQYLVRAKHRVLKWLDGRPRIQSRAEVIDLQAELVQLAPVVPGRLLPPERVPVARLLADISHIADGVKELQPRDRVTFTSHYDSSRVETGVRLTDEEVERLLTEETIVTEDDLVLLVKKPDYLGNSRWEFRLNAEHFEARIEDERWLECFHKGEEVLRPGDSLRARVRTEVARGFEGNAVATRHTVLKVHEIVRSTGGEQSGLFKSHEP